MGFESKANPVSGYGLLVIVIEPSRVQVVIARVISKSDENSLLRTSFGRKRM